jgi:hypothetical protein
MLNLDTLSPADTVSLQLLSPCDEELLLQTKMAAKPRQWKSNCNGTSSSNTATRSPPCKPALCGKKQPAGAMKEEGIELVYCSAKLTTSVYGGKPVPDDAAFRALYGDAKFSWLEIKLMQAS